MTEFFIANCYIFFYNYFTDKRNKQSDKSPVERNTQQRKIEVRYISLTSRIKSTLE